MREWLDQSISMKSSWTSLCRYLNSNDSKFSMHGFGILDVPDVSTQLDQLISRSPKLFKHDNTTSVAQLDSPQGACIAKRYNERDLKHRFTRAVRGSRAQRCWSMSYRFARIGLNVATPYMMFEKRFGPLRLDAYFVNEKLHGEELLTALPKMTQAQKEQVVVQINDAFTKMQQAKVTHGDMKATNLMWVDEQLYFIDLDASRQHYFDASFKRSNTKDKKRFMKNWKDQPELLALFPTLM